MKYKIIDLDTNEKMKENKIFVDYLKIRCRICNSQWGVHLDPGRQLTEKDLTCRKCLLDKYMED